MINLIHVIAIDRDVLTHDHRFFGYDFSRIRCPHSHGTDVICDSLRLSKKKHNMWLRANLSTCQSSSKLSSVETLCVWSRSLGKSLKTVHKWQPSYVLPRTSKLPVNIGCAIVAKDGVGTVEGLRCLKEIINFNVLWPRAMQPRLLNWQLCACALRDVEHMVSLDRL